jgi:NTP pyrophosphatase (non-canonical NTP hydrolase)
VRALTPITEATYDSASLDDWQAAFWHLYGHQDATASMYDLVLQMIADATRLAEAIRKRKPAEALPYIPRVFSWLCAMVSKCADKPALYGDLVRTNQLSEIVWQKYPNVCSLCAASPCVCSFIEAASLRSRDPRRKTAERAAMLQSARSRRESMPATLDDWSKMFQEIYGISHGNLSLSDKGLHFFEEVGEVEVELRKADRVRHGVVPPGRADEYAHIEFQDEIADVFSWLVSIYLDIMVELERASDFMETFLEKRGSTDGKRSGVAGPPFSHWIWVEFGSSAGLACHVCKERRCVCNVHVSRR